MPTLLKYAGSFYITSQMKLPVSYSKEDGEKINKSMKDLANSLVNSLSPSTKPVRDFSKAVGYALDIFLTEVKNDPAVKAIEKGSLPKVLR